MSLLPPTSPSRPVFEPRMRISWFFARPVHVARGLLLASAMAVSFILHGQLKRYGLTREEVCGLKPRQPDESWPLPQQAKGSLRLLLDDLGFEASREIWVRGCLLSVCSASINLRARRRRTRSRRAPGSTG